MQPRGMVLYGLLLMMGTWGTSTAAEPSRERVALSLSGPDCSDQRPFIVEALSRHPGVTRVDMDTVPDHVLVDVVRGMVQGSELSSAVNGRMPRERSCRLGLMESCVTAGPPMASR